MGEVEARIKELIVSKYGSLKKFCEIIEMPWTTLDSILKRGFSNSNITNVMKITKELGINTEGLASGNIIINEAQSAGISNVYFSLAKEAEQDGIDPEDIKLALETIRKLRSKEKK